MENSFVLSLYELLLYLIPGIMIILLLFIILKDKFNLLKKLIEKQTTLVMILTFSFFVGVINHEFTSTFFSFSQGIFGVSRLNKITNEFSNINNVKVKIYKNLGDTTKYKVINKIPVLKQDTINSLNNLYIYRYASTVVNEKSKGEKDRINRLLALSLFSRNSVIPLFLLFSYLYWTNKNKIKKWYYNLFIFGGFISIEILLLKAYDDYLIANMLAVLRTFVMIE